MRASSRIVVLVVLLITSIGSVATGSIDDIIINEFMASNRSTIQDGQGQFNDWIELYNDSDTPFDVAGMYLTDDLSRPTRWRFPLDRPELTNLGANNCLLIWADGDTGDTGLHAGFSLSASGEEIGLFAPDGKLLIDSIVFPEMKADISLGRLPSGQNNWDFQEIPSPGLPNFRTATRIARQETIFDGKTVGSIFLTIDSINTAVLETARLNQDKDIWVHADFRYVNNSHEAAIGFSDIGVRWKGNTSLHPKLPKNPLKLKFNLYVTGQKFDGIKKISLGTEYGDPTFLREAMSYQLLREAGIPASRTQFVRLYINNIFKGLYLLTEEQDDVFIERHFAKPDGNLYETKRGPLLFWGYDPEPYGLVKDQPGPGNYQCEEGPYAEEEQATNPQYSDLLEFIRFLSESTTEDFSYPNRLEEHLDVAGWLDLLAMNVLMVNLDSPLYTANNYRLYHAPDGLKFSILSWDMDSSFAAFPTHETVETRLQLSISEPKLTHDPRPLIDRVLAIPRYQEQYLARLRFLHESYFDPVSLESTAREMFNLIQEAYDADPNQIYAAESQPGQVRPVEFLEEDLLMSDAARRYYHPIPGLVPMFYRRAESIDAQLEDTGSLRWAAARPTSLVAMNVTAIVTHEVIRTLERNSDNELKASAYVYVVNDSDGVQQSLFVQKFILEDEPGDSDRVLDILAQVSVPDGVDHGRLQFFVTELDDDWIDPGVDFFAETSVEFLKSNIPLHADIIIELDDRWQGCDVFVKKFGASTEMRSVCP